MSTQPLSPGGLKLQSEAKPNESIIHCKGKIIAENLDVFEREIRDQMLGSRIQSLRLPTGSYLI